MNKENIKLIQDAVKEAGDYLKDKLPEHPNHPKRNSYAHLWREVKGKMGRTYKECNDEDVPVILETIAWFRANPC